MRVTWKPGQMLPTFDYTVTVLNRRDSKDSPDRLDAWKKTVLHNCAWSVQTVRSVNGTEVSLGAAYVARIPKSQDYHPYHEWTKNMEGFTFSTGDIIIRGEVTEEITADNVKAVVRQYPESFTVSLFRDNTNTVEALEHYRVEGV